MNFLKPTKRKVGISVGLTILWILNLFVFAITKCICAQGYPVGGYQCAPYHIEGFTSLFFKMCYCYCAPPLIIILLTRVIIPIIVIYFIVSIVFLMIKKPS